MMSSIIGHTIAFSLSISLIIALVAALSSIQNDYREFTVNHEIGKVCAIVKNGIEKIYWPGSYATPANTTMGTIMVDLPDKIGGVTYRTRFENSTLKIETNQFRINRTCEMGFDANITGRTNGGKTMIVWSVLDNENKLSVNEVI